MSSLLHRLCYTPLSDFHFFLIGLLLFIHSYAFSVQFRSVAQLSPTLWDPMNCSMPCLPVYHQLLELTKTHVHPVGDAIQPSHPPSSPSPPAPSPSQYQSFFQRVNSLHEVARVLEFQLQHHSFQRNPRAEHRRIDAFELCCWRRLLRVPWSKEIQPVYSKGDQSWLFFGRNDAKAETPVLWPPHAKC